MVAHTLADHRRVELPVCVLMPGPWWPFNLKMNPINCTYHIWETGYAMETVHQVGTLCPGRWQPNVASHVLEYSLTHVLNYLIGCAFAYPKALAKQDTFLPRAHVVKCQYHLKLHRQALATIGVFLGQRWGKNAHELAGSGWGHTKHLLPHLLVRYVTNPVFVPCLGTWP